MEKRAETENYHKFDPQKIVDLANGIFGFSMTLLIVNISIPLLNKSQLHKLDFELYNMIPSVLTFSLSFFLLANFWMIYLYQMKNIKNVRSSFIYINIFLLLTVVFVPLTTNLVNEYPDLFLPNIIFNVNLFILGLFFLFQWYYIVKNSLHIEPISEHYIKQRYARDMSLIVCSLIGICICFVSPSWSSGVYVLLIIYSVFIRKKAENI